MSRQQEFSFILSEHLLLLELEGDRLDPVIQRRVLDSMVLKDGEGALGNHLKLV